MRQILANLHSGALVFDVGAHQGEKTARYLQAGARVVCVEPLPACVSILGERFRDERAVTIVPRAVGSKIGQVDLHVNSRDPVVSTVTDHWMQGRFKELVWDTSVTVEQTTLDHLIVEYGLPSFVKIDVEGYERAVLEGLNLRVAALSFEFASEFFAHTEACLDRLQQLGYDSFNVGFGEEEDLAFAEWTDRAGLVDHMHARGWTSGLLAWGDVYARIAPAARMLPMSTGQCCLAIDADLGPGWRTVPVAPGQSPCDVHDLGEVWQQPLRALNRSTRQQLMRMRPLDIDGWADAQRIARIDALALGDAAAEALMGIQRRLHRRDIERVHLLSEPSPVTLELLLAYGYGERASKAGRLFLAPRWLAAPEAEDWLLDFDLAAICSRQGFAELPLRRSDCAVPPPRSSERIALALDDAAPPAWLAERNEIELILAPAGELLESWDAGMERRGFRRIAETQRAACYVRRPRLSMREIGRHGRFGNQVLQHLWFEIARRECDAVAGIAPWIGERLFDIANPPRGDWQAPSVATPEWPYVDSGDWDPFDLDWGFRHLKRERSADIIGNCQYHTSRLTPWRALYRRFMRPNPALASRFSAALAALGEHGHTLVVCHLRGTDYGTGEFADHPIFYRPPSRWYIEALDAMWPRLDRPVLYIASDEPQAFRADFSRFSPFFADDIRIDNPEAPYFVDFYLMMQADALLVANSTFSFTAAMANESCRLFLRPDRLAEGLVPFDPWNANPVLFPPESLPAGGLATAQSPELEDGETAPLEVRAELLAQEIVALRRSTSWRATAGLRLAARFLKKLRG